MYTVRCVVTIGATRGTKTMMLHELIEGGKFLDEGDQKRPFEEHRAVKNLGL